MSNREARIWAEADAADMALIKPFRAYIEWQEAGGRSLSHREMVTEFFEFCLPEGTSAKLIDAVVQRAISEGHDLLRSKMD